MIDGSLPLAFALGAGVATFFSPCAYPLLPGYVGFYVSQTEGEDASLSGALSRGLIAGTGALVTLGVLLVAAYQIGHSTLSNITLFEPIVGALLVVFGLLIVFDRAPSLSITLPKRRSSVPRLWDLRGRLRTGGCGVCCTLFIAVIAQALSCRRCRQLSSSGPTSAASCC